MFRRCLSGRAAPRRAFVNAALFVVCIAAAVIAMPAAAADAAAPVPFVSTATSVSPGAAVTDGTTLTVTFYAPPVLASSYSLTLTDGSDVGTLSSTAGNLSAAVMTGSSIAFTVHGAPSMSVGSGLSLSVPLEILESTGVSDGSGDGWDLVASGQVVVDALNNCSTVGFTRVFAGSNCDIGFVDAGPMAPGVFDVIPLPTQDLPGPPDDNAPEVVTNCALDSTDWVYDVNTEAQLGSNPCGNNPPEQLICTPRCNSNSNTLDYIPTPNLALLEEVGVVETIPGSSYVSATVVPPQLSAVSVSVDQATFSYYDDVVCESDSSDPDEVSQFTYVTPYTDLTPGDPIYASAISCPPSGGGSSITVTWPSTIPVSSGVRFKYTGYGLGHSIVGALGDSSVGEREASESAYAGRGATTDSFTPQSTTLPTSSGGSVDVALSTTGAAAQACILSAVSLPAGAAALSLPPVSCDGGGPNTITVPANTNYATNAVYTVTLTATGDAGTPPATDSITITVPAPPPAPVDVSAPTIAGAAALGQTLTESHGSWTNNPTSYSYQWEDCDAAGNNCSAIGGATAQTYTPTTADVGHALTVQETASNAGGAAAATAATTTAVPKPPSAPTPVPAPVDASPPTISGTPVVGQTLTEGHGSWSNTPTSYAYVWGRCDNAGSNCAAIPGAIAQTHTLTMADIGHTLRVQETASNASGAGDAATSSPTAPVPAARTSSKHHDAPNTLLLEHQVSSHDHWATFRFKATGTASRFECALVRKPTRRGARTPAPEYVSCRSPKTFRRLKAGTYVLYVRAVGPGGADRTPASYEFKIT
jgi:PKD repeat protein